MPHISYKEFKDRFGDLGITKYTRAMYLNEGCEEIGVLKFGDINWVYYAVDSLFFATDPRFPRSSTNYTVIYFDSTEYNVVKTAQAQLNNQRVLCMYDTFHSQPLGVSDSRFTSVTAFKNHFKGKVILYKKNTYTFKSDIVMGNVHQDITIPLKNTVTIVVNHSLDLSNADPNEWFISLRSNNTGRANIEITDITPNVIRMTKTSTSGFDTIRINTTQSTGLSGKIHSIFIYYN